jgi:hypothetical protein
MPALGLPPSLPSRTPPGLLLIAGLTWLAAACQAQVPARTPPPEPQALLIALPVELRPLEPALQACSQEQPELAVFWDEIPAAAVDLAAYDLTLWWGEPPAEAFAAGLASEELALVVYPDNPLTRLSAEALAEIFSGRAADWSAFTRPAFQAELRVWTYPPGDPLRQRFDERLLPGGRTTSLARLAPDPAAMQQAVAADPGAIGYLPAAWLTASLRRISLQDADPDLLRQPVLVLSQEEPQGAERAFLACLQSGAGQALIAEVYRSR